MNEHPIKLDWLKQDAAIAEKNNREMLIGPPTILALVETVEAAQALEQESWMQFGPPLVPDDPDHDEHDAARIRLTAALAKFKETP